VLLSIKHAFKGGAVLSKSGKNISMRKHASSMFLLYTIPKLVTRYTVFPSVNIAKL